MTEVYSIIGLDRSGKIVTSYGKLYENQKEIALEVARLQIKEYEEVLDSINAESFEDDAEEEREEASKALDDFFFDSKFGMKLYSLDHETKYHVPKTFQILTLHKTDEERDSPTNGGVNGEC